MIKRKQQDKAQMVDLSKIHIEILSKVHFIHLIEIVVVIKANQDLNHLQLNRIVSEKMS